MGASRATSELALGLDKADLAQRHLGGCMGCLEAFASHCMLHQSQHVHVWRLITATFAVLRISTVTRLLTNTAALDLFGIYDRTKSLIAFMPILMSQGIYLKCKVPTISVLCLCDADAFSSNADSKTILRPIDSHSKLCMDTYAHALHKSDK